MFLPDMDLFNPGGIPIGYGHIPKNPPVRDPGAPVPPEHGMRFPYVGKPIHGINTAFRPDRFLALPDIGNGRVKMDFQQVILLQNPGNIILINTVHVFRISQQFPIKMDFRQGIQAVEPEKGFRIGILPFSECTPVYKMIFHNSQCFLLIIPPVGIFQPSPID